MYIEVFDNHSCMIDFNKPENANLNHKVIYSYFSIIPSFQYLPSFDPAMRRPETFAYYRNGKLIFKNGLLQYLVKECEKSCTKINYDPRLFSINNNIIIEGEKTNIDSLSQWSEEFYSDVEITPRPHQIKAAVEVINRRKSVGECCTRAGKTLITHLIFSYIIEKRKEKKRSTKCLMLVPSKLLASQGESDFLSYNPYTRVASLTTSKEYNSKSKKYADKEEVISNLIKENDIIISTYQTWREWTDKFTKEFDSIFVDECHLSGANSYTCILNQLRPDTHLFGMTGSMHQDKIHYLKVCENLMYSVFSIKTEELQEAGYLCDLNINLYDISYDFEGKDAASLQSAIDIGCDLLSYKLNTGEKVLPEYLHEVLENEEPITIYKTICEHINLTKKESGNASLLLRFEQTLARMIDRKKSYIYNIIDNILNGKKNAIILGLCISVEYSQTICEELKEKFKDSPNVRVHNITGSVSMKARQNIITQINSKSKDEDIIDIIIGSYGTMSTGITIPYLTDVILIEGMKSNIFNAQSIGRALGKYEGKDKATVHDICDNFNTKCLHKHRAKRLATYQDGRKVTINKVNLK